MRIKEVVMLNGEFWLPDNEEHKVRGVINIVDGGKVVLEITGVLSFKTRSDSSTIPIIFGLTENGVCITLINSFSTIFSFSQDRDRIIANGLFLGYHFRNLHIKINNLKFYVENLYPWLGCSGFDTKPDFENRRGYSIEYKLPKSKSIEINSNLNLSFNFTANSPVYPAISPVVLQEDVYINLSSKEDETLEEFQNYLYYTVMFINFMTEKTSTVYDISFIYQGVKVNYVYSSLPFSSKQCICGWYDFRLERGYIHNNLDKLLPKWFEIFPKFSTQITLFLKAQRNLSTGINDVVFIELSKVAESYHRLTELEKKLKVPKNEYKHFLNELSKFALTLNIAQKFQKDENYTIENFIKNVLSKANEMDFYSRLEELLYSFCITIFSQKFDHLEIILKQIRDSRNYYTHFPGKPPKNVVQGLELLELCNLLILILKTEFLKQLKVSNPYIKEKITNDMYTKQLPSLLSQILNVQSTKNMFDSVNTFIEREKNKQTN